MTSCRPPPDDGGIRGALARRVGDGEGDVKCHIPPRLHPLRRHPVDPETPAGGLRQQLVLLRNPSMNGGGWALTRRLGGGEGDVNPTLLPPVTAAPRRSGANQCESRDAIKWIVESGGTNRFHNLLDCVAGQVGIRIPIAPRRCIGRA